MKDVMHHSLHVNERMIVFNALKIQSKIYNLC